ncbi:MAG: LacI family DNA-binding transcriptional regulator [Nocardioidaceae bacterium]
MSIRDVARAADVSATTVSHALNGKGRVDADTRARVLAIARQLGYRPNRIAQGLASGRTSNLALLLPSEMNDHDFQSRLLEVDFYLELTVSCVREAFEREHAVLLLPPPETVDDLGRFGIDGAIVVSTQIGDPRLELFDSVGLPYVSVDRDPSRGDEPWWVGPDNRGNTRELLEHVARTGVDRVAMLSVDSQWCWFQESLDAYREWARERGQEPMTSLLAGRDPESAEAAAGALLDRQPDAIYAPPQWLATAVLRVASQRGIRVPEDLLVATGVDSALARTSEPPVTAIDLRPREIAARAVAALLDRIDGKPPRADHRTGAELRVRHSTSR